MPITKILLRVRVIFNLFLSRKERKSWGWVEDGRKERRKGERKDGREGRGKKMKEDVKIWEENC